MIAAPRESATAAVSTAPTAVASTEWERADELRRARLEILRLRRLIAIAQRRGDELEARLFEARQRGDEIETELRAITARRINEQSRYASELQDLKAQMAAARAQFDKRRAQMEADHRAAVDAASRGSYESTAASYAGIMADIRGQLRNASADLSQLRDELAHVRASTAIRSYLVAARPVVSAKPEAPMEGAAPLDYEPETAAHAGVTGSLPVQTAGSVSWAPFVVVAPAAADATENLAERDHNATISPRNSVVSVEDVARTHLSTSIGGPSYALLEPTTVSTPTPAAVPKHAAVKPFQFNGEADMFSVWMANFEMWADSQNLTDAQRMLVVPGYIDGRVHLQLGYDAREAWPSSYDEFKERMREHFEPLGRAYAAELHHIRQAPDEPLHAYFTRLQVAARKANRRVVMAPEPALVELFIDGLHNRDVAQSIMRKYQRDVLRMRDGKAPHIATLRQAFQEARLYSTPSPHRAEMVAQHERVEQVRFTTPTSAHVNHEGREDRNTRMERRLDGLLESSSRAYSELAAAGSQTPSRAAPRRDYAAPSRRKYHHTGPSRMTCFNCGEQGHAFRQCPHQVDSNRIQRNQDEHTRKFVKRRRTVGLLGDRPSAPEFLKRSRTVGLLGDRPALVAHGVTAAPTLHH